MTRLEEEILRAINTGLDGVEEGEYDGEKAMQAAAEVAKRYIEKYHNDICEWDGEHLQPEEFLNQWLKENGVI